MSFRAAMSAPCWSWEDADTDADDEEVPGGRTGWRIDCNLKIVVRVCGANIGFAGLVGQVADTNTLPVTFLSASIADGIIMPLGGLVVRLVRGTTGFTTAMHKFAMLCFSGVIV